MNLRIRYAALLLPLLTLMACGGGDNGPDGDTFDRRALLTSLADRIITPSYNRALIAAGELEEQVAAFVAAPDTQQLFEARRAWRTACERWEECSIYNFGPARGTLGTLAENIATFPVGVATLEERVAAYDTAFQNFNRDTRGLFGIEYLLHSDPTATAVVARFSGDSGARRRDYLAAAARDVRSRLATVASAWNGSYRGSFVENDGTAAGSSLSELFNEFNISYESIKNFKLGIPLGRRAGQTGVEPTRVEAYHSGLSLPLLRIHWRAVRDLWYGRDSSGTDGQGFEEYLLALQHGPALVDSTRAQIGVIDGALAAIGDTPSLSEQIVSAPAPINRLHDEMLRHTRFFKSEMSSILGIAITYASGDGD